MPEDDNRLGYTNQQSCQLFFHIQQKKFQNYDLELILIIVFYLKQPENDLNLGIEKWI